MPPVLVTGGAGFIGSHTCKALRNAGFLPVSYDDLSRGHAAAVKWGELVTGDIADVRLLRDTLIRHRPVAVVHFAAFAYVGESTENPGLYYRNNVVGTLALLEAMRECGVRYLVFSSSCAVYGVPAVVPIQEQTPLNPVNPDAPLTFAIRGATPPRRRATRLATKNRLCRDNFPNGACGTRETQLVCRQLCQNLT